jgi:hypothetical protein
MLQGKYILIENYKNTNSVNLLLDLKFVNFESISTAEFAFDSVKLKRTGPTGETCELTGKLENSIENFYEYSQYFKKQILTVYKLSLIHI